MDLRIIMILGGLFGFIYALRLKETYSRILTWVTVASIGISFVPVDFVVSDAYYLFTLCAAGVVVYSLAFSAFTPLKKAVLLIVGVGSLVPAIFLLGELPYFIEIGFLLAFVQLGVLVYGLKTDVQSFREELGFLIILGCDALTRLIGGVMYFSYYGE